METPPDTNTPRPHLALATIVGILAAVVAVGVYLVAANYGNFWPYTAEPGTACTMEAKICPDGSGVGRTGPNCEFAPCPGETKPPNIKSGIMGTVLTGPTCPVVRENDPSCDDKPYQGQFIVRRAYDGSEAARFSTNQSGQFQVALAPGSYNIEPVEQIGMGNQSQFVDVKAGPTTKVTLTFDTGIR